MNRTLEDLMERNAMLVLKNIESEISPGGEFSINDIRDAFDSRGTDLYKGKEEVLISKTIFSNENKKYNRKINYGQKTFDLLEEMYYIKKIDETNSIYQLIQY